MAALSTTEIKLFQMLMDKMRSEEKPKKKKFASDKELEKKYEMKLSILEAKKFK